MATVDKLSVVSSLLFLLADAFAIVSISMPDWIISDVRGEFKYGLLLSCLSLHGGPATCFSPSLPSEWMLTLSLIVLGCACLTTTSILLILAPWFSRNLRNTANWIGFVAAIIFSLAAVIYPIGFASDEIGGAAYQLPSSCQVGLAYIFFVMALWITVMSDMISSRICLPNFSVLY